MLIPRFSIRWLFVLTAVSAVVFLMARAGIRGQIWSAAIVIGILFLLGTLFVHGALFSVFWILSQITRPRQGVVPIPPARPEPSPSAPSGGDV